MRRTHPFAFALLGLLSLAAACTAAAQRAAPRYSGYHLATSVSLGDAAGWDYLAFEPVARLLYISHERDVLVVDPRTGRIVGRIGNTPGVHGIAFAPEANRGFISEGDDSSVAIFNLGTRRDRKSIV